MYPRLFNVDSLPPHQSFFLFGPRSTGKSTLIRKYLNESLLVSLSYDLLTHNEFLRLHANPHLLTQDIEAKLQAMEISSPPLQVHIDEVQKIPTLLDEAHHLLETFPGRVRFIFSSSSARKLKKNNANTLGGRAWERHLHPLSYLEIGTEAVLEDLLQFGGLPSVVKRPKPEKIEQLQAYISVYLREEIQMEALVRHLDSFHRFLEAAAMSNGRLVNLSDLSREASVPRKTVAGYYQILEDTLIGHFLPSWGHHVSRKDLVTHGKFYFFDTGVVSALIRNLSGELFSKNPLFGHFFEHFIITEFHKLHDYKRTEHRTGFFRTNRGAEVDLIQEKHGKIRAIEIKAAETVHKSDLSGLFHFADEFPEAELIVVSRTHRPYKIGKAHCLPWTDFLRSEWE